jgi:intracellular septation protein
VAFFIAYKLYDIFWATGTIILATLLSLLASWIVYKKVALMPLVTAAVVSVFGGLTLWLDDPTFLYRKPTIVNLLFAGTLAAGHFMGRPFIKMLLGEQLQLTDEGWNRLTVRWILFFLTLAGLNELVWRNFPESTWVNFKVFGILALTFVFAIAQVGLMKRYASSK